MSYTINTNIASLQAQDYLRANSEFQAKTKVVLKLPKGEFYTRVETARGELGVYIVSEGGTTPYRIKFRSPGFSNLSALDHMSRGGKIGDLVATTRHQAHRVRAAPRKLMEYAWFLAGTRRHQFRVSSRLLAQVPAARR